MLTEDEKLAKVLQAGKLLHQIKTRSPECAYWVVAALDEIRGADPKMSAAEVYRIVCNHLPEEAKERVEYLKTT